MAKSEGQTGPQRSVRGGIVASLIAATGACAGGGGGGPAPAPIPFTPTTPTTPTNPQTGLSPASFETNEYYFGAGTSSPRTSALSLIGASTAYATGATGQGVTIAVIDTDIHPTITAPGEELAGKITAQSIDLCANRQCGGVRSSSDADPGGHGSFVASIIAANKNDQGSHGVAFGASILSIRADRPNTCANTTPTTGGCRFDDATLVRGIDYAIAQGAKVINISLGGEVDNDPSLENAVRRAAQAGVLVVISAGNDAKPATGTDTSVGPSPLEPAYIAGEAASLGRVVAVGAIDMNRKIASFSNRAGQTKNYFILAPGAAVRNAAGDIVNGVATGGPDDNVITPDRAACSGGTTTGCNDADNRGNYYYVSGTSFSAPFVSGSLALLLQQFPNLKPEDALSILLATADDYVDPNPDPIRGDVAGVGVDAVSGVGILNLARAFTPVGVTTASLDGVRTPLALVMAPASGATGDWLEASGVMSGAVVQDVYDRGFRLDAAHLAPARAPFFAFGDKARFATSQNHGVAYGSGSFSWYVPTQEMYDPRRPWVEAPDALFSASYSFGGATVTAGRGGGPRGPAPSMSLVADPSNLAQLGGGAGWMSVERRDGAVGWDFQVSGEEGRSFSGAGITFGREEASLRVGFSQLRDDETALGGRLQSRFGFDDQSRLSTTSLTATRASGPWTLTGLMEAGRARMLDARASDVATSAWTLSAVTQLNSGTLRLTAAQPRRAETGRIILDVPVAVLGDGRIVSESRIANLTPSGREIDLEAAWSTLIGARTSLEAAAALSRQPNHVRSADDALALWVGLRHAW